MDELITFHLNSEDKKKILEIAKSKGLGYSPYIRTIVLRELKSEGEGAEK